MASKVKFINVNKSEFFSTVKQRINDYFTETGKSRHANSFMVFKTILFLGTVTASYLLLIFGQFDRPVIFLLWTILGVSIAFSAVNICHDAIHGAYSANKTVNTFFGYVFNVLGANAHMWHIMHNIAHHTYPNIDGHDEDIEPVSIIKVDRIVTLKRKDLVVKLGKLSKEETIIFKEKFKTLVD